MGLYLSTYIGPVLVAKYTEGTRPVPFRACLNPDCTRSRKPVDPHKQFDWATYCSQCGTKLETMTDPSRTEKVRRPTQEERWAALESTGGDDERLMINGHVKAPPGHHVFVPNIKGPRDYDTDDYPANFMFDIDEADIDADKLWFVEAFAKEIEAMSGIYEQVEVRWVFMNYES